MVIFFNYGGYNITMDLTIGNGKFGNTRCDGNGPTMEESPTMVLISRLGLRALTLMNVRVSLEV